MTEAPAAGAVGEVVTATVGAGAMPSAVTRTGSAAEVAALVAPSPPAQVAVRSWRPSVSGVVRVTVPTPSCTVAFCSVVAPSLITAVAEGWRLPVVGLTVTFSVVCSPSFVGVSTAVSFTVTSALVTVTGTAAAVTGL